MNLVAAESLTNSMKSSYERTFMKPLASLLLITYNQNKYVSEAIDSLVNQTYENFEIIISDDASTDGTQDVILKLVDLYKKSHPKIKIKYNFNLNNLDIGGNISEGFKFCEGEFIIPCAGDDTSEPNRCSEIMETWIASGYEAHYIYSDVYDVNLENEIIRYRSAMSFDEFNTIEKWLEKFPVYIGAGTWSKKFFNLFGDLYESTGEDQILSFRAMLLQSGCHIKKPLVKHRIGGITGFRPLTLEEKLKRMHKDSLRGLNDIKKLIDDSKKFDLDLIVQKKLLVRKSTYELYVDTLLSYNKRKIILSIITKKYVPIGKKIRIFIYKIFPYFSSITIYLKKLKKKNRSPIKF